MTNMYSLLSGTHNRIGRIIILLITAFLTMATQQASAEVHYIYHEQTTNNPGCGPNYMSTTAPTNAAGVQLGWKIEYQFYTTNTVVYYTTDGTTPSGSFGVGTGTTQVLTGSYNCTFGGPVVDVATATIPAQAAGKTVKYIISAWHSGGGAEIFANGPGSPCGCGTPTSNAGLATVFSYTVAASNNVEVTATGGTALASYSTLKGAFDAINAGTHTGIIAINLWGNTTETASASLNASGAPASYTSVTITPKNVARTISGNIVGAVIKLNGADNVTIDGRIGGSGNFINVTNTSTSAGTAGIWLSSTGVGAGATNNIIRNLNIACGADQSTSTTLTMGIIQCGTSITTVTDNGNDNDNNQYLYNNITKCRYGIVTRGVTTNLNQGIVVSYNTIGPTAFGSNQIGKVGIFMQADQGAIVSNNTVQFVGGYFANTTSGNDRVGIAIGQESWSMGPSTLTSNSYTVTNNIIHDIIEERGVSAVGITLSTTGGGSPTNNIVANNFIYNVRANGGTSEQTVGIGISGGHTDKVVFNTIYLTGDTDPSASATATANFGSGIRIANADGSSHKNLTIKNNIVYMDLYSSSNASIRYYAISGNNSAYDFGTGGEDYNAYYINPSNAQVLTGGLGSVGGATLTSQYASLAAWQGAYASGQDVHSVDDMPLFTSATDLHMQYNESNAPFNGTGVAIAGVTTDIDGATRLSPPDMGADEFTIPVCTTADGGTISPSSDAICDGDDYVMSATGATTGYDITYQWEVSAVGGGAGFANVTGGTGATTTTYTTDALAAGTYYYRLKVTCTSGAIDGYSNEFELTVNPLVTYYADADADTYGDGAVSTTTCDGAPIGYVLDGTDCDDTNADINPGIAEICNGIDDDCNGDIDNGLPYAILYADADADTYGDAGTTISACIGYPGYVENDLDCNDADAGINPDATEICNAIDDDCDGVADDGLLVTYYADADSDTYGDAGSSTSACDGAPAGYVADDTDCDDTNADINPGATEICNAVDDDCSGVADDGLTFVTYYKDYDEDGYGAVSSGTVTTCDGAPATYVAADGDCDDFNADLNPGEVEICNFIDDNCSGISDEGLTILTFYLDADSDTYGTPLATLEACGPTGPVWVSNSDDCDDSNADINPAATEVCNGVDDDCDGSTDEGLTLYTYYADAEGDGFGDAGVSTTSCSVTPPPGYADNNIDCQPLFITYTDADGDYFGFGAPVPCGPVINNVDCDDTQLLYSDADSDGYGSGPAVECGVPSNTDCAPFNNAINPGATETCNAIDDDCDGTADDGLLITYYADADSDTYGDASNTSISCSGVPSGYVSDDTDCDDTNADINPGESEICNAVDDDCSGVADDGLTFTTYYADADSDTYGDAGTSTSTCDGAPVGYVTDDTDCDDTNENINPAASEICNAIDDDCDGAADDGLTFTDYYTDADGDGYGFDYVIELDANSEVTTEGSVYVFDDGFMKGIAAQTFTPSTSGDIREIQFNINAIAEPGMLINFQLATGTDIGGGTVLYSEGLSVSTTGWHSITLPPGIALTAGNVYYFWIRPSATSTNLMSLWRSSGGPNPGEHAGGEWYIYDSGMDAFEASEVDDLDFRTFIQTTTGPAITACTDPGAGYSTNGDDCDDENENINPGETEICNGIDDNCSGVADDGLTFTTYYADADSDTYGDAGSSTSTCDGAPAGYVSDDTDCDDTNENINPGETEICNGIDDDCSGVHDDGPVVFLDYYVDADADGYGQGAAFGFCEAPVSGWSLISGDCDDADENINPGETEICNGIDDDCSGVHDDGPVVFLDYYMDADADGYGQGAAFGFCEAPVSGWSLISGDCDDADENINPGETEICNGIDDDCSGVHDDGPVVFLDYYVDADADGYGQGAAFGFCEAPVSGWSLISGDCDDADENINPGETEICNGIDDDCSGVHDDGPVVFLDYYMDADADGYGQGAAFGFCEAPVSGWSLISGDCDDADENINPGETEICNGIDDDCSGVHDDGPVVFLDYYVDADADGYGQGAAFGFCEAPVSGWSLISGDCDDADENINPGETEICNAVDDDCSGVADDGLTFTTYYADADSDTYGDAGSSTSTCDGAPAGYVADNTDCDDSNAGINPGATEICNAIDDNCDGNTDEGLTFVTYYADADSDTYGDAGSSTSTCDGAPAGYVADNTDCDDSDADIHPGVIDLCNGIDNDCDGNIDEDALFTTYYIDGDGDTYGDNLDAGTTFCYVPAAPYVLDNTDCNDASAAAYPGATEICDGIDNNCDGNTDDGLITATVTPEGTVTGCKGSAIELTATAGVGYTYQWYKNANPIPGATNATYNATKPAYYQVMVTIPGGCSDVSGATLVQFLSSPNANISAPNGTSLCALVKLKASFDATYTWQWYLDGSPIPGATNYLYNATVPGSYRCRVTNAAGCSRNSATVVVTACKEGEELTETPVEIFEVYPNPTDEVVNINMELNTENTEAQIFIVNIMGDVVYSRDAAINNGTLSEVITLDDQVAAGLYFVKVYVDNKEYNQQLVIQK